MKLKNRIFMAAALVAGLAACENAEIRYDDVTGPGRIFLNEAIGIEKLTSFVIPDAGATYTVTPRISKPLDKDLVLTLYVDEAALEAYNRANNTAYVLLPEENYTFEETVVIPAGKVVAKPVSVALKALSAEQNKTGFVHALPISVKAGEGGIEVLDNAGSWILAATPVPFSNVVEITGQSYLQLLFAESYKLPSWTFETLFNPSEIYNSNATSWLASAVGLETQSGNKIIQGGFMLRLGDSGGGTHNSILNGQVNSSGKQVSSIPLKSNLWYHIALVCDAGNITLYVNGNVAYKAKAHDPATQFYALNGIRLGGENCWGGPGPRRYRYCQVRFWEIARSVEELNNNRYAVPADTPGLLGYWKLNAYEEGTAMVPTNPSLNCVEEDTPMTEAATYLFRDETGKQPDAHIRRSSESTPYLFTEDKRIEIGYTWDGVPAQ